MHAEGAEKRQGTAKWSPPLREEGGAIRTQKKF